MRRGPELASAIALITGLRLGVCDRFLKCKEGDTVRVLESSTTGLCETHSRPESREPFATAATEVRKCVFVPQQVSQVLGAAPVGAEFELEARQFFGLEAYRQKSRMGPKFCGQDLYAELNSKFGRRLLPRSERWKAVGRQVYPEVGCH
jgi:hypothetical protein